MCPFLDKSDERCSAHWTFDNLAAALSHCADDYATCPIHKELKAELFAREPSVQHGETSARLLAAS